MKDLTVQDLIKIIPFKEEMRNELLAEYETYDEDKKFEIMRILWDGYDEIYEAIKAVKEEQLLQDIANGTRHISGEVHEMVEKEVEEELEKRLIHNPEDEKTILGIRGKLEELIATKK